MVRPLKPKLDYFPLDTDIDQDDDIYYLESKYGLEGFAIYIKLLLRIYGNSYFLYFNEKQKTIFCGKNKIEIELFDKLLNDCLKDDVLFSDSIYKKYEVLTSREIQNRYLKATIKRSKIEMYEGFICIDDFTPYLSEDKNRKIIIVDINPVKGGLMYTESTQSKAKQSKAKQSKKTYAPNGECESFDLDEKRNLKQKIFDDRIWPVYPARSGKKKGKREALDYFLDKFPDKNTDELIRAVENFAKSNQVEQGIGIMDLIRFFRTHRGRKKYEPWRDWIEPEKPNTQGSTGNTTKKYSSVSNFENEPIGEVPF